MKKFTVTLDPSATWNTDMWHRKFDGKMPRESLKLVLDAVTTVFHSYLHDIPCGIPHGMEGLAELLNDTERRKKIKEAIHESNRMVAFVNTIVLGISADITFCTGKKVDYSITMTYRWCDKSFEWYGG